MTSRIEVAFQAGWDVIVSPIAVAETTRGNARDARTNQLLAGVRIPPIGVRLARRAGELLARSGTSAVADALVMAEALAHGPAVLLTSDPLDMRRLAGDSRGLTIIGV